MKSRKERSDKGKVKWSPREIRVLTRIADQYAVRIDHLERLLALGARAPKTPGRVARSTARMRVARWERAGVAEFAILVAGQPGWTWLTTKGLGMVGRAWRRWEPNLTLLEHLHAINGVRWMIEQRYPQATWRSERELRSEQEIMRGGERQEHRPDAELTQGEHTIAIEVELTPKRTVRFRAILYELAAKYRGIWYFTRPEMLPHLERTLADLDVETRRQFVVVALADEAVTQAATPPPAPNPVFSSTERGV